MGHRPRAESMILTCPTCGSTHSAEGWENDIAARETLAAVVALPGPVGKSCLGYLSLFRPEQRALTWKKAKATIQTLAALVAPGWVQIQGKPARTCPPHLWAQAMDQMVERAATLQRPLKNHNYLRAIAWQLADQTDAGRERQQHQQFVTGEARAKRQRGEEEMSETTRLYIEKHGEPTIDPEIAATVERMRQRTRNATGA